MAEEISTKNQLHIQAAKICFSLLALILTLAGIDQYIDYKIDKSIQNEDVIRKLQKFVRPSMIFDQNGSVLSDQGAYQFIEKFQVSKNDKGLVNKITITPKEPNLSPILIPLDTTVDYYINEDREKGLDIVFELNPISYSTPRPENSLFNLEITPGSVTQYGIKSQDGERETWLTGKFTVDGKFQSVKKPGNACLHIAMGEDPTYVPSDGMMYFDTRYHSLRVYSQGKWRNVLFDKK